jgi:hypothetical protein
MIFSTGAIGAGISEAARNTAPPAIATRSAISIIRVSVFIWTLDEASRLG